MSEEYVSQVLLEINGQSITDFKSLSEDAIVLRKAVKLMKKTGFIGMTPQYGVKVDYVIPKDNPRFDFAAVAGGTLTIDYENGTRIKYTGVSCTEIGETRYDSENEAVQSISFVATKRT